MTQGHEVASEIEDFRASSSLIVVVLERRPLALKVSMSWLRGWSLAVLVY